MAITFVASCLDSIHATTLRWALWHDGHLRHNTNLHLFTSSNPRSPNGWPANVLPSLGLIFAYGGATVMTFPVTIVAIFELKDGGRKLAFNYGGDFGLDRYGISFNAWGLLGLGTGFLLQSALCT